MTPNVLPPRWTLNRRVIHAIADAMAQFAASTKVQVAGHIYLELSERDGSDQGKEAHEEFAL